MLNSKVLNLLNTKINDEFFRSNQFLDISGWAADLSLNGVQGYFQHLSAQALANVNSLIEYVNECGHEVQLGEINEGVRDFDNIEDVFVYLQQLETSYKADLNNLLDVCQGEKDFATYANLLEQARSLHADEFFVKSLLDKIAIVGCTGHGLYLIDKDLEGQYPIPDLPAL